METNREEPAFEIVNDKIEQTGHSLSADLAMGWRPKLKVIGPIPLNFDNPFIDKSIKEILKSEASIYSVIYLGPRPLNTFKMHEVLKKRYKYKYQHLFSVEYGHLKAFFHKFYSEFEPKMKMPFLGILFEVIEKSGNLDCVVKVGDTEYDLILRIDSNTAGHIMWYYFKVTNNDNKNQRVKFNIVNLRRNKSCYQRGMKPFIRKKKRNLNENELTEEWTEWEQGGINVEVTEQKLRYAKQTIVFNSGIIGVEEPPMIFRRLSFEIGFEPFEEMEFAYCVPYTYSEMITDIKEWKQSITDRGMKNVQFAVDMSNESLSGLEIPVIKITEKEGEKYDEESEKNKQSVFIIGRQHPGESNGSWVMKGLISQLIDDSSEIRFLRKHIVFTIVPMLNVDGVVMGNFRTSLYGKDLNRLFRKQQLFLIPEVEMCKEEFNKLLKVFKTKIMLFLDVHGHSARRNAFCYGPGILDSNAFNDVREFAKIIATKTEIFRYPSCSFRIEHDKKTTARACFSKSVRLAYTIEASNWSFYSRSLGTMVDFTSEYWESIGIDMVYSLCEYAEDKIIKTKGKVKKNKNKNNEKNTVNKINEKRSVVAGEGQQMALMKSQVMINERESPQRKRIKRAETTREIAGEVAERNEEKINSETKNQNKTHTDKLRPPSHSTSEYQQSTTTQRETISKSSKYIKMEEIEEEENESDKYSDNEMDSDSEGEDMEKSRFERYMNGAKRMMIEFEKVYLGDEYEKKGRTAVKVREEKARLAGRESKNVSKNSEVLACLRKKEPIQQNQQPLEINSSTRLAENPKSKPLSQPHRKSNQTSLPLNTKQIQFQYEQPQEEPIARQIMLINHKAQYQKILLPRIEESYQLRRKREYLEGVNVVESNNKEECDDREYERLEEWTYGERTPQLITNNDDGDDEERERERFNNNNLNKRIDFNNNINNNRRSTEIYRHKSITNYERHLKRNNRVDFYKKHEQKDERGRYENNDYKGQEEDEYEQQQMGTEEYEKYEEHEEEELEEQENEKYEEQEYEELQEQEEEQNDDSNNRCEQQQQYSHLEESTRTNNDKVIHIQSKTATTTSRNNLPLTEEESQHLSQHQLQQNNNNSIPILRYSMKLSSPTTYHHTNHNQPISNNHKESMLTKTKRELEQIKRIELIEKLSDPISKGYGDIVEEGVNRGNINSGVSNKSKKKYIENDNQIQQQQEIQQLSLSSERKRIPSNNNNNNNNSNKIKEIILNNLQEMKDSGNNNLNNSNRKSYARSTKREKPKVLIEERQERQEREKFSIEPVIMYKSKDIKGHDIIRDSIINKHNNNNNNINNNNNNINNNNKLIPSSQSISISPQKQKTNNSNLLFELHSENKGQSSISSSILTSILSPQQMISASVILPRTNIKQERMLEKIKTLESENLNVVITKGNIKLNELDILTEKITNNSKELKHNNVLLSSTSTTTRRNYSERERERERYLQNNNNNNVHMIIKEEEKLNNNNSNNNKAIKYGYDSLPKLEEDKREQTSSIHKHMSRTKINSLHKNTERESPLKNNDKMKKLKPMATSGAEYETKQQKDELMMRNINLVIKNGYGQEHEQEQQYNVSNVNNNINKNNNNNNKEALITRLKQLEQEQTNEEFTEENNLLETNNNNNNKQSSSYEKGRYGEIGVIKKEMKIFSLPVNNVCVNNNKFTISNGGSGLGSLNINNNKQQLL